MYLYRVLLRNIWSIGVLWPKLFLLTIWDDQLVSLRGQQQLRPLGAKGASQLRVQINHLRGEQHLGLLLL